MKRTVSACPPSMVDSQSARSPLSQQNHTRVDSSPKALLSNYFYTGKRLITGKRLNTRKRLNTSTLVKCFQHPFLVLCVCTALLSFSGCAPDNQAVGNSQNIQTAVGHDSVDLNDILVGFIGSGDTASDNAVMQSLSQVNMKTVYAFTETGDSNQAAQQAVRDFSLRAVSIIVVNKIDVTAHNEQGWESALQYARNSGTPVVLLNPIHAPQEHILFAAQLTLADHVSGESQKSTAGNVETTVPLNNALESVINNNPHPQKLTVTLPK